MDIRNNIKIIKTLDKAAKLSLFLGEMGCQRNEHLDVLATYMAFALHCKDLSSEELEQFFHLINQLKIVLDEFKKENFV